MKSNGMACTKPGDDGQPCCPGRMFPVKFLPRQHEFVEDNDGELVEGGEIRKIVRTRVCTTCGWWDDTDEKPIPGKGRQGKIPPFLLERSVDRLVSDKQSVLPFSD